MASTIVPTLKKANVGIAVVCSAATWPRHAVNKEAMVQYGKIHARGLMSNFASSSDLGWRLQDKLRVLLHRSPHAFNKWNGGSDLQSNAHLFI